MAALGKRSFQVSIPTSDIEDIFAFRQSLDGLLDAGLHAASGFGK
jgi:hypothetical protein